MNNDLISRSALFKRIQHEAIEAPDLVCKTWVLADVANMINTAPAVDAEPVRHGRWIDMQEDDATEGMWRCSVCSFDGYFDIMTPKECGTNYCPNCGAKMDAEVKE